MLTADEKTVRGAARDATAALIAAAMCAVFSILLVSLTYVEHVPNFVILLVLALAALSAWRPSEALLVVAAAVPVASWTGRWWNWMVAWPEVLVVAFAAGYAARAMWDRKPRHDNLRLPIFVFSALVIASLAVRFLVLYWTIGGTALWEQLLQLARGEYFISSGGFRELDAAMRLIEGMVLLRAAATATQENPLFAPRLTRWFVVGATAAAALNLWRLFEGALRAETPVATFFRFLTSLRYNVHYSDVNAAGSYFVMALLVAIGLVIATRQARWLAAAIFIATSLMLSGSRAALLAGVAAALVWGAARVKHRLREPRSRTVVVATVSLAVIAGIGGAVYYASARRNLTPSSTALQIRGEFARTTFRMIADYPAFGLGIGEYADRSSEFSSPILVQTFRMRHENAHNNFLQILGELGILGLCGFLWVLGTAGWQSMRLLRDRRGSLPPSAAAGLLAFTLTWLSGHPLLLDEPSLSFWLLLGTAAGWSYGTPLVRASRVRRAVLVAIVGIVLASIPLRARREVADTNLEHRGIGLSAWQHGDDGVRYRVARTWSTVFVPSYARGVTIPLRSIEPGAELVVSLRLNGRPANVVRVTNDRWHNMEIVLPVAQNAPRFYRLDLHVEGVSFDNAALLKIGKVEPR